MIEEWILWAGVVLIIAIVVIFAGHVPKRCDNCTYYYGTRCDRCYKDPKL